MSDSIIKLFQIDAFTSEIFKGNPACVMPLENWLSDDLLLKIAKENNVSETAFFIKKNDHFYLRWFTPEIEMDLIVPSKSIFVNFLLVEIGPMNRFTGPPVLSGLISPESY